MEIETRQSEDSDVIETRIICDNCRKEEPLEQFNGNSTYRVPANWVRVAPQIARGRYSDDSLLKQMNQTELNEKIKSMIPVIHLCEDCLVDKKAMEERRAKKQLEKERKEREKEQKKMEKANQAIVEVTRVTSGRRLLTEAH